MLIIKKIIPAFSFILISFFAIAQPSGYMGKRFIAGTENGFNVSGVYVNAKGNRPALMMNYGLSTEYVVSRIMSIGINASYSKTGVEYNSKQLDVYNTNPLSTSETSTQNNNNNNGYSNTHVYDARISDGVKFLSVLNTKTFQFNFKWYRKRNIAPLGLFFKFSLFFQQSKLDGIDTRSFNGYYVSDHYNSSGYGNNNQYSTSCPVYLTGKSVGKITSMGTFFTFGKQHIFFDKLVFNYGLRLGHTVGMLSEFYSDFEFLQNSNVNGNAFTRLTIYNIVSYQVGLGYLLF